MAKVYRLDITRQNCWLCTHFRRNSGDQADPNEGSCTARHPRARGAVPDTTGIQDDVHAQVVSPSETICGDFKLWEGTPREIIVVVE